MRSLPWRSRYPTVVPAMFGRALLSLSLTLGLLTGAPPRQARAQTDACPEPNNGFNTACFVGAGRPTLQGFIGSPDDVDAYKFEVSSSVAAVLIELTALPADYDLHLFSGFAGFIDESVNQGTRPEMIELFLLRGPYFLFVNAAQGASSASQPYSLSIQVRPIGGPPPGLDGDLCPEPNDTPGTACSPVPARMFSGNLASGSDVDLYRFEVAEANTLVTIQLGDTPPDFRYDLLSATGEVEDELAADAIMVGRREPGPFFVRVQRTENAPAPAAYQIFTTMTPPDLVPVATSKDPCPEPNDTVQTACPLEAGTPVRGFISSPADMDNYTFVISGERKRVHLELTDQPVDYDLELQQPNGDSIASSMNGGTFPEALDAELDPGSYLVLIYSRLGQASDDHPYNLALTQVPAGSGQIPAGRVLLAENFAYGGGHFSVQSSYPDDYELGQYDGEYVIKLKHPAEGGGSREVDSSAGVDLRDVQIDFDARLTGLPDQNGGFSISWHYQDGSNTYAAYVDVVDGGRPGAAKLTRWQNGDVTNLVDWQESDAIRKGGQTNHVTVIVRGDSFSVAVNGQTLLSARDQTFQRGDIAFGAATWDRPVEVRFDNLLVTSLS